MQHQRSPRHIICIEGTSARIYAWADWSEVALVHFTADMTGLQIKSARPYLSGHRTRILLELSERDGPPDTRGLHLLDVASFGMETPTSDKLVPVAAIDGKEADSISVTEKASVAASLAPLFGPLLAALAPRVAHVIGLGNTNQLIFLDTHSWVCSADLESLGNNSLSYSRHFFVPYDLYAGTRDLLCAVAQRDVLFARNNDLAIIKGGLEYAEKLHVELGHGPGLSEKLLKYK